MNENDKEVLHLIDQIETHLAKASLFYMSIEEKRLAIVFHLNKQLAITNQTLTQLRKDVLDVKVQIKLIAEAETE